MLAKDSLELATRIGQSCAGVCDLDWRTSAPETPSTSPIPTAFCARRDSFRMIHAPCGTRWGPWLLLVPDRSRNPFRPHGYTSVARTRYRCSWTSPWKCSAPCCRHGSATLTIVMTKEAFECVPRHVWNCIPGEILADSPYGSSSKPSFLRRRRSY